jgi:hypothetical protein
MWDIINEKKEPFVVTVKGEIPEIRLKEFISYTPIIRNIEIRNCKCKNKQTKLTQLMTTTGKFMIFSSPFSALLSIMSVFHINENG